MSCYFDRDSVSLPGFAHYFRHSSLEEREHAQAHTAARPACSPSPPSSVPAAHAALDLRRCWLLPHRLCLSCPPACNLPAAVPAPLAPRPFPPAEADRPAEHARRAGAPQRHRHARDRVRPSRQGCALCCLHRKQPTQSCLGSAWGGPAGRVPRTQQRLWRPHAESPSLGHRELLPVSLLVARVEQRVS
jgi:hypothetical protein